MSVSVRVKAMRPVKCPHCGEIVCYKNLDEEWTRGKEWMELLEDIGYYTPYDDSKSHAENFPYYADDMILTDKQVKTLLRFLKKDKAHDHDTVWSVVNYAIKNNYKVVINADW